MAHSKVDIYEIITQRMIQRIETEGILPWKQPWKNYLSENGQPQNLVSRKAYRGANVWILSAMGYASPFWVTFQQAQKLGGSVKKGEKGTPVVYWFWFEKDKESQTKKKDRVPVLRYYTVFNVEQCEGITIPSLAEKPANDPGSIETCEQILAAMPNKPRITYNEARAYYSPVNDAVNLPKKESFNALPEFYATFFHELIHATGHSNRCARFKTLEEWNRFGSDPYAKEELVAEMGATFLCGIAGIQAQTEDNSVAYIKGWISRFKEDKKLLVHAAGQAQKGADFILGTTFEEAEKVHE